MGEQKKRRDGPIMTDVEFSTGLADATARGLIEWENDEDMRLTDKGIDRAIDIREELGDTDYIIMQLFYKRIEQLIEDETV